MSTDFHLEPETHSPVLKKPRSAWREKARAVIAGVVTAHAGQSRKQMRKALRAAYSQFAAERAGYAYKAWCDEVAYALRDRSRRPGSRPPFRPLAPAEVMPATRQWLAERGQLEVTAVLDVDLMDSASPPSPL